ncbi:TonB-dependent receptor domain-containing protein [Algibacillus agarilyticus]|uniref:TonB-dependent receptor domain-containing protein n=1 Tax=Algibacillus agarilyticus TaxID=2234133 RepID=UPI000DD0A7AB|nr:TonB-dependent receptor [Algibacillus agarilyticus]
MKKTLLATSIISAITLGYSAAVFADDIVKTERILVTANRSEQNPFDALAAHTVIGQVEIERLQAQNIGDLLDKVAGVNVVNQGGTGQQTSIFMRGNNSGHTLVLIDGVRVGSATTGSASLASIPLAQIERIEVVKGARAALWGSDAIGGVIQIFTKKFNTGEGVVSAGFGSHGFMQLSAATGFGNQQDGISLAVNLERADGIDVLQKADNQDPDSDGYDRQSVTLSGRTAFNKSLNADAKIQVDQGGTEYDNAYSPTTNANENSYDNYLVNVGLNHQFNAFTSRAALSKTRDKGSNFGQTSVKSSIQTERELLSVVSNYAHNTNTSVTAGFDAYKESVSSGDLDSWTDGIQGYAEQERTVNAWFLQANHQVDNLLLESAIRHDRIESVDNKTTYNLAAGLKITPDTLISLSRSTGFKAPTFNDLYWPGSGNPELIPEVSLSNELLVRHQHQNLVAEMSVYKSKVDNLIAWAPNASGNYSPANVNLAEIKGVELNAKINDDKLQHEISVAWVEAKDAQVDQLLARRPKFTASYTASYNLDVLTLNSIISYRDESFDKPFKEGEERVELDDVWKLDLSAQYDVTSDLAVFFKWNNVFDADYETAADYQLDDANFKLSATYSF